MRLISYQRSATQKQNHESNSVEKQRSGCKLWAIKSNHEIIERYHDNGFGSYHHLAPSFQVILKEIKQGNPKFQGVVVHSYSRISRNNSTFNHVIKILKEHNIKLFSVTE